MVGESSQLNENRASTCTGCCSTTPAETEFMLSELLARYEAAKQITGDKQDRVRAFVLDLAPDVFRRRDVERALPDVSAATIRLVLNELREAGRIRAEGSGRGARWHRLDHADEQRQDR